MDRAWCSGTEENALNEWKKIGGYLRNRTVKGCQRAWKKKLAPWRKTTTPVQPKTKSSNAIGMKNREWFELRFVEFLGFLGEGFGIEVRGLKKESEKERMGGL